MLAVLVILLGVALEIVKANGWFIVPNMAINIVFGIGAFLAITSIIGQIAAKKRFSRYVIDLLKKDNEINFSMETK